jgi:hypothetical protein
MTSSGDGFIDDAPLKIDAGFRLSAPVTPRKLPPQRRELSSCRRPPERKNAFVHISLLTHDAPEYILATMIERIVQDGARRTAPTARNGQGAARRAYCASQCPSVVLFSRIRLIQRRSQTAATELGPPKPLAVPEAPAKAGCPILTGQTRSNPVKPVSLMAPFTLWPSAFRLWSRIPSKLVKPSQTIHAPSSIASAKTEIRVKPLQLVVLPIDTARACALDVESQTRVLQYLGLTPDAFPDSPRPRPKARR